MTMGDQVRKYRQIKGLTLKELGKLSDMSLTALSDVEIGRSDLSIKSLRRVAGALKVDIADLFKE